MGFKCPHCSEDIPGAMSQETHRERLKAKEDENTSLKSSLTEAQKKAKLADSMAADLAAARADIAARDAAKERGEAFSAAGIPDKVRSGFEAIYNSTVASAEEGKAPTFTDWLNGDDAKGHPLLSDHYGKAGTTEQPKAPADGKTPAKIPDGKFAPKPTGGLANTDKGGATAPDTVAIDTPAKLQTYLRSPAYRAQTKEAQAAELATLSAQVQSMAGQIGRE